MKIKKNQKKLLAIIAVIIIVFAGAIIFISSKENKKSQPISAPITYSTPTPSEEKPDDNFIWQGALDHPKKITIASIGVDGYVQNVGVDQNQEVAVPNNIHMAGWFADSVIPGQKGLSVIDGHVDGNTQTAIFGNLADIKKGAEILIELGDGSVKKFEVIKTDVVNVKDAPNILFSQDPKVSSQLNLITCIGNYDQSSQRYDKRVIVSSKLLL